jgi:hypothetical protein
MSPRLADDEYRHPSQATRVRLVVYQKPEGFLVTEERIGSTTVVSTLGLVPSREAALDIAGRRGEELVSQRFARVAAG